MAKERAAEQLAGKNAVNLKGKPLDRHFKASNGPSETPFSQDIGANARNDETIQTKGRFSDTKRISEPDQGFNDSIDEKRTAQNATVLNHTIEHQNDSMLP